MGVTMCAQLVVGYQMIAETSHAMVTRYHEVTGKPYEKSIPVTTWCRQVNCEPVDAALMDRWYMEGEPGLTVFVPGDDLNDRAVIGRLVHEVCDYSRMWAQTVDQTEMQTQYDRVKQYADRNLGFSGFPQYYLLTHVS